MMGFVFRFRAWRSTSVVAGVVAVVLEGLAPSHHAEASVAVAASLDELVRASSLVAVVTPVERTSVWEGNRIVSYFRVHVDECVHDERHRVPENHAGDVWVRALGGVKDGIGQVVDGEAKLVLHRPSLLFLRPSKVMPNKDGHEVVTVTAQDQGEYAIVSQVASSAGRASPARALRANRETFLVPQRSQLPLVSVGPSATVALDGRELAEAKTMIDAAWSRTHAK